MEEMGSNFIHEIIDADLAEGKVQEIPPGSLPSPTGYLHRQRQGHLRSTGALLRSTAACSISAMMTPTR